MDENLLRTANPYVGITPGPEPIFTYIDRTSNKIIVHLNQRNIQNPAPVWNLERTPPPTSNWDECYYIKKHGESDHPTTLATVTEFPSEIHHPTKESSLTTMLCVNQDTLAVIKQDPQLSSSSPEISQNTIISTTQV